MEGQASNLCSGCLAVDRRMLPIQNSRKEQCFLQIIKELAIALPNSLALSLCWECEANLTRFTKFKLQVKHSYQVLQEFSKQNTIPKYTPRFSIQAVVDITLSPNLDNVDSSDAITNEYQTRIKYETDNTDDVDDTYPDHGDEVTTEGQMKYEPDENIDDSQLKICNPTPTKINQDKLKTNSLRKTVKKLIDKIELTEEFALKDVTKANGKRKDSKIRKKGKLIKKNTFIEIEMTEEEINEERKDLALRDDYVNAMFRCERCLTTFPNEDDMKDHNFKKHELHALKHKCSICDCSFSTELAYNYHRRRHARRYQCTMCSVRCTSKLSARNHCTTVHLQSVAYDLDLKMCKKSDEKYPCEHCPKVFSWNTSLRKHLETHKIEAGQKRRPYCEPCRQSFTTTANLQKHVKTSSKHQIQLKLRKLKESNPDSNDKQIADIKSSVNSKRELFPCAQCDKKFQWRGNLLRHLHSHAARAAGDLVCSPCNRTFSSIATYNQHMKISKKHASENDFKYMCSDCGKKFSNKTKLKDHVDWEHLKNYVHTCTECQKVFKTHTSLYLHRQVVHKKTDSEHLCESCGKSFPNQTKLRSHIIALHTSESPYKCSVCGARFSWHSCLSRHLRRVHRTK